MQSFDPRSHSPLGLPSGSIRGLLTLLIVAVIIAEVARGRSVEILWTETLMIALAHYFTSRRFIQLPAATTRRLEDEGLLEREANPLYLPRHSIRTIVVVAFLALAVYLYQKGRLFEPGAISILGMVLAYLVGVVLRGITAWWTKGRKTTTFRRWEDVKAMVVLIVLAVTAGAYLLDQSGLIPVPLRNATLALVLFYFGSR